MANDTKCACKDCVCTVSTEKGRDEGRAPCTAVKNAPRATLTMRAASITVATATVDQASPSGLRIQAARITRLMLQDYMLFASRNDLLHFSLTLRRCAWSAPFDV